VSLSFVLLYCISVYRASLKISIRLLRGSPVNYNYNYNHDVMSLHALNECRDKPHIRSAFDKLARITCSFVGHIL